MKPTILLAFTVVLAPMLCLAAPATVDIAGTSISLPNPKGFSHVGHEIQWLNDRSEQFVPATNRQLAMFIEERELGKAMTGAQPEMSRRFVVQIARRLEPLDVSLSDFAQVKRQFRAEYDGEFERLRQELPRLFDQAAAQVRKEFDIDLAFKASNLIPLPPHEESGDALASSAYMKVTASGGASILTSEVATMTTTLLHIKGKVLFLYVYGGRDDLDWTRAAAANWTSQISDANFTPSVAAIRPLSRSTPPKPPNPAYRIAYTILVGAIGYWLATRAYSSSKKSGGTKG